MTDGRGVEAWVDAAKQHRKIVRDEIGNGVMYGGREFRFRRFEDTVASCDNFI